MCLIAAGGGLVFGEHQEITAAAGAEQFGGGQIIADCCRRFVAPPGGLVPASSRWFRRQLSRTRGQEHLVIALLDGRAGEIGVGADVCDDAQVRGRVEEDAAHDFGQDVFRQAGEAGVVEQDGAVGVVVAEQVVRQPAEGRFLRQARRRFR